MMTRQMSRQEARQQAKLDAKIEAAMKTSPLVQAAYKKGWNDGAQHGVRFTIKDCYAAALLAMNRLGNYGHNGGMKLMSMMDEIVVNRLTTEDLIDEVFEKMGIRINFRESFDRVEEVRSDG